MKPHMFLFLCSSVEWSLDPSLDADQARIQLKHHRRLSSTGIGRHRPIYIQYRTSPPMLSEAPRSSIVRPPLNGVQGTFYICAFLHSRDGL